MFEVILSIGVIYIKKLISSTFYTTVFEFKYLHGRYLRLFYKC